MSVETVNSKVKYVDGLIKKMTLEQKVGQCLVLGFVGTVITPEILQRIRNYYPAGIRAGFYWRMKSALHDLSGVNADYLDRLVRKPVRTVKDFLLGLHVPHCTNAEYCAFLNRLKQESLNNDLGIPVHVTFDVEGDRCDYYRGGINYFPYFMGIAKSGKPERAYELTHSISKQMKPLGFGWSHSFVLDVNSDITNPEINIRSFGEDADTVIEYAKEALRGYQDGGIIATGKHFPGRGHSSMDAHARLPVIDLSRDEMEEHLRPYRAMIELGLPSVMTAHTAYPSLDPSGLPATLSKPIITGILKEDMGFKGSVTTDAMSMGGIIEKYQLAEACIMSLEAGCDLVLIREENAIIDEVFPAICQAVESGRLPLERLEDAVRRTLGVKYDYGFFNKDKGVKDPALAGDGINDPQVIRFATESANEALTVMRDEQNVMPLSPETKVLLIEQLNPLHELTNDQACHPGIFWEKLLAYSDHVAMVETHATATAEDQQRVRDRLGEADVFVVTNYFSRRHDSGDSFIQEIHTWGKPVIVVTNCPYAFTVAPEYKTVICTYSSSPQALAAAAGRIYGGGSAAE